MRKVGRKADKGETHRRETITHHLDAPRAHRAEGTAAFPQAAGDTGHGATAGEDWPFHSKRARPESPFHAQAFPRTENTGLQEDVGYTFTHHEELGKDLNIHQLKGCPAKGAPQSCQREGVPRLTRGHPIIQTLTEWCSEAWIQGCGHHGLWTWHRLGHGPWSSPDLSAQRERKPATTVHSVMVWKFRHIHRYTRFFFFSTK